MTEKCLRYIIDEYSKLENQELKEDFMCKWIDCLTLVEGGTRIPTLLMLEKYANALGKHIEVSIRDKE